MKCAFCGETILAKSGNNWFIEKQGNRVLCAHKTCNDEYTKRVTQLLASAVVVYTVSQIPFLIEMVKKLDKISAAANEYERVHRNRS